MGFSRQEYWSGVPLPSPIITLDYINGFSDIETATPNNADFFVPDTPPGSIQSSVKSPVFLLSLLLKKVYGYID